jgi:hypothetical protein
MSWRSLEELIYLNDKKEKGKNLAVHYEGSKKEDIRNSGDEEK